MLLKSFSWVKKNTIDNMTKLKTDMQISTLRKVGDKTFQGYFWPNKIKLCPSPIY